MATKKRKPGRPNLGISETAVLVRMPRWLLEAITLAAKDIAQSRTEWMRDALALKLKAQEGP